MTNGRIKRLKKLGRTRTSTSKTIRVLYVEDATVIRDTMARLLMRSGYAVAHAKNGAEGIEKAIKWRPDVVLMDLRMPVMDGFEAINQLREHPKTKALPIFVVSAWAGKKERQQAKLAGADAFFEKPPDLDDLMAAINAAAGMPPKSGSS